MNNWIRGIIGWLIWTIGTWAYALIIHTAPEGGYAGAGSAIEIFASLMAFMYFAGVPFLTVCWIIRHTD